MDEDRMRHLLELAARIEQVALDGDIHQELILMALENIRELMLHHTPPAVEPQAEIQARPAPAQMPIPQIWLQAEPIADQGEFLDPLHSFRNPEPVCYDELDPNQLAQLNEIPFLFHNGGWP